MMSAVVDPPRVSVFNLRRIARRRAWICPGAGLSLMGYRGAAAVTFLSGLATPLVAAWAAWSPSRGAIFALVALLMISTATWLIELVMTTTAWPRNEAPAMSKSYWLGALLLWASFGLLVLIVVANLRLLEVSGAGMSPVLYTGDRILYHRRVDVDRLTRGTPVLFKLGPKSKFREPGTIVIGRILAVPKDRLSIREGQYYVNDVAEHGVAPTGEYTVSLEIPRDPGRTVVPDDCYFVVQDSPEIGLDSRVFSWARREDILSTNFYRLGMNPFFRRIE